MSTKNPIIVALDVPSAESALKLAEQVAPAAVVDVLVAAARLGHDEAQLPHPMQTTP